MRLCWILFCGWLLPFFALADPSAGIELRLVANDVYPGDVIEIHAEMQRADFAEFELHVPANPQLHFVAQSAEPLRYLNDVYVQRSVLLLQPMTAGEFKLGGITATVQQGETVTEVALPTLTFSVQSYAAIDESKELAPLIGSASTVTDASRSYAWMVLVGAIVVLVFWWSLRKSKGKSAVPVTPVETLDDLAAALERGEAPVDLIERLLARSDLVMSSTLREALERAAYANRMDVEYLLDLLRKEAVR